VQQAAVVEAKIRHGALLGGDSIAGSAGRLASAGVLAHDAEGSNAVREWR
jgi:hypothetical protein